jgi:hypothetical protein
MEIRREKQLALQKNDEEEGENSKMTKHSGVGKIELEDDEAPLWVRVCVQSHLTITQSFKTNTGTGQLFHSLYVLCKQVQRIHESSSSLQKMWYFGLRYVFQR